MNSQNPDWTVLLYRLTWVLLTAYMLMLMYLLFFFFDLCFTALSRIFHLYRAFIEGGRKPENPEKNHLTIYKQNLAFPHMT